MIVYHLFGVQVAGPEEFFHDFPEGDISLAPDLTVSFQSNIPIPESALPILHGRNSINGTPRITLTRDGGVLYFVAANTAIFAISQDTIAVQLFSPSIDIEKDVRTVFLTYVVTCWLELCGKPCLHGASLLFPEGTITCLAHKGTGKSSLTVALLKAGGRLMCDDITPVNIMGSAGYVLPGPPMMHVWPVQRDALGLTAAPPSQRDSKPIKTYVNVFAGEPEIYCKEPQEFGKIFILERDPQRTIGAIEVTRLGPAEALFQLSNYTFAPLLVRALQLEKQRTALLSVAASGYPVFRIKYPTDLNRISEVASAILNS